MESDFNISRNRRTATALLVLREAGNLGQEEQERLLKALWSGWREVMCIRLGATIIRTMQGQDRRRPG